MTAAGGAPEFTAPSHPPEDGRIDRAELRGDLPGVARLVVVLVVAGLPLGALWALLAPGVTTAVLVHGGSASLTGEADHTFDAVAIFVLLVTAFGVLAGALAWRRRARRGPLTLAGAVLGALVGAWVAGRVGTWLSLAPTPVPVLVDHAAASASGTPGPALPAALAALPASPGPWWLVLTAGLGAALAYLVPAIALGQEDLSRP